jgi:glycine/D-amino acid oxidase-like deaminating enzyme
VAAATLFSCISPEKPADTTSKGCDIMESLWNENALRPVFPTLPGSMKTDVLIIGGGMAGLLCAHRLKKAGVDCVLVEAKKICCGVTGDTTAKITLQHGLIYHNLIGKFGQEKAHMYLQAQQKAGREFARLCQNIPCDYEKQDSYVYSMDDQRKIEKELSALNALGCNAEFSDCGCLLFSVAGAVRIRQQAQFHPLKFAYEISKDLPIYENTKVLELMPGKVLTNRGQISCKKIIVATHFPILNKHGSYFLKLYQHRSYVVALDGAQKVDGMYVDEDIKGLSFRNYGNLLLLGGGSHRTGKRGGNWRELEEFAQSRYPSARIAGKWATQDCMTLDAVPYIGQYSKNTPDLYVATGFNKWGMTSSMVSAMILSDLVQEKENEYAPVFAPSRSILRPQLAVNAFESVMGLLTPTAPRCPHLGCALKYNKAEHSWDCPCHGSRFTESGKLINNPATDDKKMM